MYTRMYVTYKLVVIHNDRQLETGPCIVHADCIDRVETTSLDR